MSETPDDTVPVGASPEPTPYQAHLAAEAAGADAADRGPALLDWRVRWEALSSTGRLRFKQAGLAAAIGVLGYGLYSASTADKPAETAPQVSKLDMGAGLRGDSLEVKLRGDLKKVLDGQLMLGDRVAAIEQGKTPIGSLDALTSPTVGDTEPLPPALPGGNVPDFPPSPGGVGEASLPAPPSAPLPPSAPPAPPVEKIVGAIGAATTPIVPKDAAGSAPADSKKRCGRSICRLVS